MPKYKLAPAPDSDTEQKLLAYSPLVRQLLYGRGITSAEEAEKFLNPHYENHTHDPFLMKDVEKAVERILRAVQNDERIAIFSDYDADGIPGAVVLHDFFKRIGHLDFENYIPDRHGEGFGLNGLAVEELATRGAKLLITIDCGITDVDEVARANELGIDVIITDHHIPLTKGGGESASRGLLSPLIPLNKGGCRGGLLEGAAVGGCNNPPAEYVRAPFIKGDLPPAFAILNPKQTDCAYPEKMLCGSGVVFKLVQALCSRIRSPLEFGACDLGFPTSAFPVGWEKWMLDMVGLATMSDMVPLTGENRVFAYYGLKVLKKSPRKGLNELLSVLKLNRADLNEDDIGFSISPRINAASRMGAPMDAFHLFATTDEAEAATLARHLDKINNERKGKVASLVKEVKKVVEERGQRAVVVAGNPNWRPALLGLVANSLAEDMRCPVFLWGREESPELKGSCRSDGTVDLSLLMQEASSVFSDFGGHKEAGGFSTTLEKVHLLESELERAYEKIRETRSGLGTEERPDLVADAALSFDEVNERTWQEINRLAPFGVGNPKPLFLFENAKIRKMEQFGKEKQHLKLIFAKSDGVYVNAIKFYTKPGDFSPSTRFNLESGKRLNLVEAEHINLLAHLEKSTFGNRTELRLRIVDII